MPGGVSSPVRASLGVGGEPLVLERGEGAWVFDVDGRRYLDLVQSYGAVILGHGHPVVTGAIEAAATKATSLAATTPSEVALAEEISRRVPGVEQVRFTSSGTEAAMTAIRLARAATGRDRVVKFAGCYHGHADAFLASGGSGLATLGMAASLGVPNSAVADTVVVPYNEMPALDERVACVIVEPVAANMSLVRPKDGFLAELRSACDSVGALLIFDEVITAFRIGPGAASELFCVRPDIWCFGKVIGGGLPIGALGAPRELMSMLAPEGPVYQAGTLSGNPVATAVGLAVLQFLARAPYEEASSRLEQVATTLEAEAKARNIPLCVEKMGLVLGVAFSEQAPTNFDQVKAQASSGLYASFYREMLERGVSLPPSPYEAWFMGFSHGDREVDYLLEQAASALSDLSSKRARGD
jgi:glutamate-1-semialdehyde 2,1-aminomutase